VSDDVPEQERGHHEEDDKEHPKSPARVHAKTEFRTAVMLRSLPRAGQGERDGENTCIPPARSGQRAPAFAADDAATGPVPNMSNRLDKQLVSLRLLIFRNNSRHQRGSLQSGRSRRALSAFAV
jgi:hypothetical protein